MPPKILELCDNAESTFHEVPIIDLSNSTSADEDESARQDLVEKLYNASTQVGFFYVKNHGIPETIIEDLLMAMKDYFALPLAMKMQLLNSRQPKGSFRGYSPFLDAKLDPGEGGGRDLNESFQFNFKVPVVPGGVKPAETDINLWPYMAEVEPFRQAALGYYQAVTALGYQLYPLFAEALHLPRDWFADKTKTGAVTWKGFRYPPQPGVSTLLTEDEDRKRTLGIGAHTDFDCFTILWQQPGHRALQVLNPRGEWIDAPPLPGTLVVNIGEVFTRITNNAFKSTKHRVINRSGAARYSMPAFFAMDPEVLLEVVPSCASPDVISSHEVISAGEFLRRKLMRAYGGKYESD